MNRETAELTVNFVEPNELSEMFNSKIHLKTFFV